MRPRLTYSWNSQNAAAATAGPPGTPLTGLSQEPERITQAQARVARMPEVVERVLDSVSGTGMTVTFPRRLERLELAGLGHTHLRGHESRPRARRAACERLCIRVQPTARSSTRSLIERALADVEQRLRPLERTGNSFKRGDATSESLRDSSPLHESH